MFTWLARTLAVAVLAPLALPAQSLADQSFTTTGSISYTWQGDPARGCAAEGLCGVRGALTMGSEGLSGSSSGGPARGTISVPIGVPGSTARVSDGAGAGDCIDVPSTFAGGNLLIRRRAGGGFVGRLASSVSSGRCAGPLAQDLAGVALPVKRSGGKRARFDLHATRSFSAGPFTGRLVSTLVVTTETSGGGFSSVSSGPSPVAPPAPHRVLLEQVTLRYRVASLPGTLDVAFSGEPDPFCAALDSCGATGSLAFSLPRFDKTLVVEASRVVPSRVDARRALADLKRGRLHPGGGGTSPFAAGSVAQASETFAGSGGLRCQDTSRDGSGQLLAVPGPRRSRDRVSVVLNRSFGSDLLRTHCPGPSDADAFGTFPARTSIGPAQLLARHSVISLTAPGSFAGFGYVGSRSGALRFSLTLERVRAGTVEVTRL